MLEMEASRDTTDLLHPSDEYKDDNKLELSLGLSCGGSRSKINRLDGSNATTAGHVTEPVGGAEVDFGKLKYSKVSFLDASLKKFLKGRFDEQDESQQQDAWEVSGTKDHKKAAGSTTTGIPHSTQVYQASDSAGEGISQEIQFFTGLAAAGGQFASQYMPLDLIDALKTDNELEQQTKFQEARKRRKLLIDEQKQQKKGKREEDGVGYHGVRGLDAVTTTLDAERAFLAQPGAEQEIRQGFQGERDRDVMEKGFQTERHRNTENSGGDTRGVELNLMPHHKPQGRVHDDAWILRLMQMHQSLGRVADSNRDMTIIKTIPGVPDDQQGACQRTGSPSRRGKVSSQSSSAGMDNSKNGEEKDCGVDGEASSAPPASTASDTPFTVVNSSFLPSAARPFPVTSFSLGYPHPVPLPDSPGAPFAASFSFPYLMQYMPGTSNDRERGSAQPVTRGTFQLPSLEVPPLEGTSSWIRMQPSTASPVSNSKPGVVIHGRTAAEIVEDQSYQGTKVHENALSGPMDISAAGNHPLFMATSLQPPAAAFSQPNMKLLSSLPIPAVSHFGHLRAILDPRELCSFKEQGGINAFPGIAGSVQADLGVLRAPRSPSNVVGEGERWEKPQLGGKADTVSHQVLRTEHANITQADDVGQEGLGQTLGGEFHRGSTDNLPVSVGLAQELADLRPGIPPGLKFGGTGSSPDLPWVSTTGLGPNGRTVCGVLYRLSRTQMKIVCACHGKHMSPREFIEHAGGVDISDPKNIVMSSFSLTNQAGST